jgi:methyl-accepting chemotaxis protein
MTTVPSRGTWWRLKIRGRLFAGFAAVCLVLACAVGYTIYVVGSSATTTTRMVELRAPVAMANTELVGDLYATLATLRGYLLTGNPQGKADRAAMWKELDHTQAAFDKMAEKFTRPENRQKWAEVKAILAEFRSAQDKAEAIAFTPDAQPATKLLLTEAAPRAERMTVEITKMIEAETALETTAARKALLKTMADVRGNLGLAVANIRAYLLAGDDTFKAAFQTRWDEAAKALAAVNDRKSLLSAEQGAAYEAFVVAHREFAPLPARMFEIRQSPSWNMPVHILATEAAPRAGKILDILDGPKGADGTRSGGMKDNQQSLLKADAAEVIGGIGFLQTMEWLLLGVGLTLGVVVALVTAHSIVKPTAGMTAVMNRLSQGDKTVDVPSLDRADEIGEMAKAVEVFKHNAIETDRLRAEQEEQKKRAEIEKKQAMNDLADRFEASVKGVVNGVSSGATEMRAAAESLSATAEETSRQATAVAAASEQASTNVQTVASAAEELSSSISEISRQVSQSATIAGKAVDEAQKTDQTVQGLAAAASKIGEVVKLINDIASQTNLLALNATIEAARAGEAGKGFAVVASEVKSLAAQTAKATEEIAAQINAIQASTGDAVTAIKGIGATIAEINEIATTIASAVEEQGAATKEISRNVQQASAGTAEVSSNIGGVTQAAQSTGSAASQMLGSASELSEQSEKLRAEVDRFLAQVRAA